MSASNAARQAFRSRLREARRESAAALQAARQGRQDLRALLAAPTFDSAALTNREFSVSITPKTTAGGMPRAYDSRTA